MTQQQSLFRAILDAPEDDAPRLVYADWLEDNGQAQRCQLIRVQCELARIPPDDPRRQALQRQEAKLLRGRKKEWKAELPALRGVRWGELVRGFVGEAIVQSSFMFHRHARRIVEAIPLQVLRLRTVERLRAVGNSPCARHLRELHVVNQRIDGEVVQELADSPHLGKLEVLDLAGNALSVHGATILAQARGLPALRVLDLTDNRIGPAGGLALAGSRTLTKGLTSLRLGGNPLEQEARRRLREAYGERVEV
jgi:uncharacterized protein (TIGR02996 family)